VKKKDEKKKSKQETGETEREEVIVKSEEVESTDCHGASLLAMTGPESLCACGRGEGERIATASEQRHETTFSPEGGRKSADGIVLPFPIEGQAFNGGPNKGPRNDRGETGENGLPRRCAPRNDKLSAAPKDCHSERTQ